MHDSCLTSSDTDPRDLAPPPPCHATPCWGTVPYPVLVYSEVLRYPTLRYQSASTRYRSIEGMVTDAGLQSKDYAPTLLIS